MRYLRDKFKWFLKKTRNSQFDHFWFFYHEQARTTRTFTTILHCNLQISFEGFAGGVTILNNTFVSYQRYVVRGTILGFIWSNGWFKKKAARKFTFRTAFYPAPISVPDTLRKIPLRVYLTDMGPMLTRLLPAVICRYSLQPVIVCVCTSNLARGASATIRGREVAA